MKIESFKIFHYFSGSEFCNISDAACKIYQKLFVSRETIPISVRNTKDFSFPLPRIFTHFIHLAALVRLKFSSLTGAILITFPCWALCGISRLRRFSIKIVLIRSWHDSHHRFIQTFILLYAPFSFFSLEIKVKDPNYHMT